ncbi:hypothetical protein Plec18167_008700 [Paecilomyces lecythidis]|uniref:Antigenic cell wall galactomannoprotein n=1 Tax=Paecilomyces lecythidis TaxID=3004212 RepID=A0ABR3WVE5_9EURO
MHFYPHFLSAFIAAILHLLTAPPTGRVVESDAAAVIDAVDTITADLATLNHTVSVYSGGFTGTPAVLRIKWETWTVEQDLISSIKTTERSGNFTKRESRNVAIAFVNLQPVVMAALDNLMEKKTAFETGLLGLFSLTELVKSDLVRQKALAAELGEVVVPKLTEFYAALAPLINNRIASKFDDAIEEFTVLDDKGDPWAR